MKRWIVSAAVVGLLSTALSIPAAAPLVAPATPACEITQAKSREGTTPSRIEFVNASGTTVNVLWLDYQGNRVLYRTLLPSESYVQQTFITHPWIAVDTMGLCRGYVLSDRPEKTFRIAPRPTFTAVVCRISVVAPSSSTCTAQVADASPQRSNPPTGTVTFTATSGTIGPTCTLQGTPGSPGIASCTVPYLPSTSLVQGEPPPVRAKYGGDAFFNPSSGGTSFLPSSIFLPSVVRVSLNEGIPANLVNQNPFPVSADVQLTVPATSLTTNAVRASPTAARKRIGHRVLRLKPLSSTRMTLNLNRLGRSLLAQRRTLRATLTITTKAQGKPVRTRSRVVRITARR